MDEEQMSWKTMTEAEKIEDTDKWLRSLWICFTLFVIITAPWVLLHTCMFLGAITS